MSRRLRRHVEIALPWPPAVLSANSRANRFERAAAIQQSRAQAKYEAYASGFEKAAFLDGPIGMTLIFHFPDNRRRDADNCLSRMKAVLDGLCDAFEINDERLWPITLKRGQNIAGGRVVIKIGDNHAE